MIDPKVVPNIASEVEVPAETLRAIDRGIADVQAGRTTSIEDVRQMIPKWLSKYASPTKA